MFIECTDIQKSINQMKAKEYNGKNFYYSFNSNHKL